MKAVFLRNLEGFTGRASLYELDEEVGYDEDWNEPGKFAGYTRYVVVSATDVMDDPETYIFPADENGNILCWQEMSGSYRGGLDHAKALRRMGATIERPITCEHCGSILSAVTWTCVRGAFCPGATQAPSTQNKSPRTANR